MEENSKTNEKEEKELMFALDDLEKCTLCGKDGA